ncbi:MAG: 4-hydroxy-tetrahydrodipicolinate synthase [Bacteroidota bacterium]
MERLHGTGVALVTPFNKDLTIDFTALERLLSFTAENGVDYFVVLGTTGESATLTTEEKKQILRFVKDHNPRNLPIVYGLGGNNTNEIITNLNSTDLKGVDAILSVSPYYNKPSQSGIVTHYEAIADASSIPVILYNVPGRTGSNISADTTLKLAQHQNIIGIKDATGDIEQAMRIVKHKPEGFMLISGDDILSVPLYAIGAVGVISVMANAFGSTFKEAREAIKSTDFRSATLSMLNLLEINPLMYEQSNPVGIKEVLNYLKVTKHFVRLPLVPASKELSQEIIAKLKDF